MVRLVSIFSYLLTHDYSKRDKLGSIHTLSYYHGLATVYILYLISKASKRAYGKTELSASRKQRCETNFYLFQHSDNIR